MSAYTKIRQNGYFRPKFAIFAAKIRQNSCFGRHYKVGLQLENKLLLTLKYEVPGSRAAIISAHQKAEHVKDIQQKVVLELQPHLVLLQHFLFTVV